jgi:hypothetical protein
MPGATDNLSALSARARHELDMLAYPALPWVKPREHGSGAHVYDVLIVGGGQSGLAIAHGLIREGITNIVCIDRNPAGYEGPWETFARMGTLRTPKFLVGTELGFPSLSIQSYYVARFGRDAWDAIDRVPRTHWMDYLRWYRQVLKLPGRNDTHVLAIGRARDGVIPVEVETNGAPQRLHARRVVVATGYDGCGEWRIPSDIRSAVPADRVFHSNGQSILRLCAASGLAYLVMAPPHSITPRAHSPKAPVALISASGARSCRSSIRIAGSSSSASSSISRI